MNHNEIFANYIDYCTSKEEINFSKIPELKESKKWKSVYIKEFKDSLGLFYWQNDDILGYFNSNNQIMYINNYKLKFVPIYIINDLIEMSCNFFGEENVIIIKDNTEEFNLLISTL